ncbi:hypothetical protein ADUPG1_010071, partial [Aduncisulcus paluster]
MSDLQAKVYSPDKTIWYSLKTQDANRNPVTALPLTRDDSSVVSFSILTCEFNQEVNLKGFESFFSDENFPIVWKIKFFSRGRHCSKLKLVFDHRRLATRPHKPTKFRKSFVASKIEIESFKSEKQLSPLYDASLRKFIPNFSAIVPETPSKQPSLVQAQLPPPPMESTQPPKVSSESSTSALPKRSSSAPSKRDPTTPTSSKVSVISPMTTPGSGAALEYLRENTPTSALHGLRPQHKIPLNSPSTAKNTPMRKSNKDEEDEEEKSPRPSMAPQPRPNSQKTLSTSTPMQHAQPMQHHAQPSSISPITHSVPSSLSSSSAVYHNAPQKSKMAIPIDEDLEYLPSSKTQKMLASHPPSSTLPGHIHSIPASSVQRSPYPRPQQSTPMAQSQASSSSNP